MKRIVLFVGTNLAVLVVISVVLKLLGLDRAMYTQTGISYGGLLAYAAVVGFTGSIISLLISKPMAKWSTGAHVIEQPSSEAEAWLVETVRKLATTAGIGMPEVAIYDGAPNAFATGAFKNSALVAVSTGLLQSMNKEEVEAVLGHEIAHVANGDMVTLTLIQGVVNTFVVFFARIIGTIVDKTIFRTERGNGPGYFITYIVAQIVLSILATMIVAWFSRQREFRADAGSAKFLGTPSPMVNALRRLGGVEAGELPKAMSGFGITDKGGVMSLFATHPPIEERIAALSRRGVTTMIELYTAQSSNGQRATIALEECGLPYRVHKLELMKGEQKTPEFLALNPAGAIPVMVDPDGPGGAPITLSQSGAIALYAAEKTGKFLPRDPARRAVALQWLMYAVTDCASASMMVFFESVLLPEKQPANLDFCQQRLLQFFRVADARLAGREFLADELSLADFALYPIAVVRKPAIDAAGNLGNLTRWMEAIGQRPAVAKAMRATA